MTRSVRVSVIGTERFTQGDVPAGDPIDAVIGYLDRRLAEVLPDEPDLIVLGELCDMPADIADDWDAAIAHTRDRGDRVRDHVARLAKKHSVNIVYPSLLALEDGVVNAASVFDREGALAGRYVKNYLLEVERDAGLVYGRSEEIIRLDVGTIAPVICFDLNFAELRARYAAARPDIIVFSSAFHGSFLQQLWAYECGAFLVSAIKVPSPSRVLNPLGEVVASSTNYTRSVTATINLDRVAVHFDHNVETLRTIKAERGSEVTIADPGYLGSVLLTSNGESTAREIADAYGLETLTDYWRRSQDARPF